MRAFVLDVSACLPWCCEDEQTDFSEGLLELAALGSELHVPSIWPFEIFNSLVQTVRRKRLTVERAAEFLEQLKSFAFLIDPPPAVNQ
jgi:predicted nucleic acid-binding protein